jgi:hypothetical protein
LLAYHQFTTLFDFFPFNGSRNYSWKEKLAEAGGNGILMILPPIGFGFNIHGLMIFGVVYYLLSTTACIVERLHFYHRAPTGPFPTSNTPFSMLGR